MKSEIQVLKFPTKSFNLCLQVLYDSILLLRVAQCRKNMMRYFSRRHKWHVLVTVLKALPLASFFKKEGIHLFERNSSLCLNSLTLFPGGEVTVEASSIPTFVCPVVSVHHLSGEYT